MNKSIIYALLFAAVLVACDPIEDRQSIGNAITAEQLDITATPVVENGKKSNKIILENRSPVLSLWDYGLGTTNRAYDEILLVLTGENKITFTGLNPDGTKITKELTVTVDELSFEVPQEWALLCGDGSKTWVWDDTRENENVWGNGGYLASVAPAWWMVPIADLDGQAAGEGTGAEMVFSTAGATLTKIRADGTVQNGSFSFDMSKKIYDDGGNVWASGKLYTKNATVLVGKSPDEGGAAVYEYDILTLTADKMVLSYAPAGTTAWGTAYFWTFRAK